MPSSNSLRKMEKVLRLKNFIFLSLFCLKLILHYLFCNFFNGLEISVKFCVSDTHIDFCQKKNWGTICTFC
jgi:hypothetical protein